jgi:hypothetical protein
VAGSNLAVQARHGFDVVVQDFDPRVDHRFHSRQVAVKVRYQQFDTDPRAKALNPKNRFCEMTRAAVRQIIAIYGSHDDVLQAEILNDERYVARFFGIERQWFTFIDGAEPATARAGVS